MGNLSEKKQVESVNRGVKPDIKLIKLTNHEHKIVKLLKRKHELESADLTYILSKTGLAYPDAQRALMNLTKHRVLLKIHSEYHLAAFPKGVIIYPND